MIKITTGILIVSLIWWPFRHKQKKVDPLIDSTHYIGANNKPMKCLVNTQGIYLFGKDGSWGTSDVSCDAAIDDWKNTPDRKLVSDYKL